MTWLWIALAGGLGAVLRHGVHTLVARAGRPSSLATLGVNVAGSFAAGVLAAVATRGLPAELAAVVGVGLLGGFTTFSTASVEVARLLNAPDAGGVQPDGPRRGDARPGAGVALAASMLVGSLLAAALGWWLGGLGWPA